MSYLRERHVGGPPAVHRIVAHAYYRNRFYRAKLEAAGITPDLVASPEDLAQLPLTSRDELAGDPRALVAEPPDELSQVHVSTGSTGQPPLYVFFSWDDLMLRGLMPLVREAPGAGLLDVKEGECVVNALPYEVSVTGLAMHRALQDGIGACVVPVGKDGAYADAAKTLRIMRQLEPEHLFTTPSYALHLAELSGTAGVDGEARGGDWLPARLKSVWLVGEPCSPALRRRIERCWQAPAFLYYGSLEAGPIGLECARRDGHHIATNFVHVEVLPIEWPERPEVGEIVVTVLWRHASPLLRFRTGDLGYWDAAACPCGLSGRRLHVLGRREDLFGGSAARRFVIEIEDVLLDVPDVSPWFRLRMVGDRLTVLLPQTPSVAVMHRVQDALASLSVPTLVEFTAPEPHRGGKLLRLAGRDSA